MARYSLKDETGKIVNIIELEARALRKTWNPPAGFTVTLDPTVNMPLGPAIAAKRIKLKDVRLGTTTEFEVVEGI